MREIPLWTGLNLVSTLKAYVRGPIPDEVTGVSIDTRTLNPGDLFLAIKGERNDGHDYLYQALDAGASAVVIEESRRFEFSSLESCYIVRDVQESLNEMGLASRERCHGRIIGVTGSVGKTSTKEMLRSVLSRVGNVHASLMSYNNHWGVPLSLARMRKETKFGLFEIGMNHPGEIKPLTRMVRPHIALITNIFPVHLESFDSVENIANEKADIFSSLEGEGVAILPHDSPYFENMRQRAVDYGVKNILTFGHNPMADASVKSIKQETSGMEIEVNLLGKKIHFYIGVPGEHFVLNALSVLLCAEALNLESENALAPLAYFSPPTGRGERVTLKSPSGFFMLINESYNANPASMVAALNVLGQEIPPHFGRRIAILGDMLELGPKESQFHAQLLDDIERNKIDLVCAVGERMKILFDSLPSSKKGVWARDVDSIRSDIVNMVEGGDIVMVKGSNSLRMAVIVSTLQDCYREKSKESEKVI